MKKYIIIFRFRQCLNKVNTTTGNTIGAIFFNKLKLPCFDVTKLKCRQYKTVKKCIKFKPNKKKIVPSKGKNNNKEKTKVRNTRNNNPKNKNTSKGKVVSNKNPLKNQNQKANVNNNKRVKKVTKVTTRKPDKARGKANNKNNAKGGKNKVVNDKKKPPSQKPKEPHCLKFKIEKVCVKPKELYLASDFRIPRDFKVL